MQFAVGGCVDIDEYDTVLSSRRGFPSFNMGYGLDYNTLLLCGCKFNQPAVFWRREAIETIGLLRDDLHFILDYEYFLRLTKRFRGVRILRLVAAFRVHAEAKTARLQETRRQEHDLLAREHAQLPWARTRRSLLNARWRAEHFFWLTAYMLGCLAVPDKLS
jgi:GT2 family glycosyltransferase